MEEGIICRELSDNYVFYSSNDYDTLSAASGWAQETLETHSSDTREYVYSLEDLEAGKTHDDLWNAAQLQFVKEGHMHGFVRMYWAKKILEWSENPDEAIAIALYLNDHYSLDGADSNGFAGVMWSIAGVHDPPKWGERPVYGKIRYMSYNGCKGKFDIFEYIKKYQSGDAASAPQGGLHKYYKGADPKQKGQGSGRVQGSWGGGKQ